MSAEPLGLAFVTECEVTGSVLDPSGHIPAQLDDRTWLRAIRVDLLMLRRRYPGSVCSLVRPWAASRPKAGRGSV